MHKFVCICISPPYEGQMNTNIFISFILLRCYEITYMKRDKLAFIFIFIRHTAVIKPHKFAQC